MRAFAVVFVSALIGLLISEAMVRLTLPQVTMFPRYAVSEDYELVLPPDVSIEHAQGSRWRFVYTTNRLGRRGPFVPYDDERPKVVVLGDSFTFGIGVNDADVYTESLTRELRAEVAVINGGMPGWGIDSEIKWFDEVGRLYHPSVVILQFTANDPADSDTGVTTVDAESLAFHPYGEKKPLWQQVVSGSGLLQRSHLFSLVRAAPGILLRGAPASRESGSTEGSAEERRYEKFLETFARQQAEAGRKLLFVSVTHQEGQSGYRYDVDAFPLIAERVQRLQEAGLLKFVELPLAEMARYQGSPEGHQWGADHHRVVGTVLAQEINSLL